MVEFTITTSWWAGMSDQITDQILLLLDVFFRNYRNKSGSTGK